MKICLYQDRQENFVSIQLAVLTLSRFEPDWSIDVYLAWKDADDERWLRQFGTVTVLNAPAYLNGFNAKPAIILDMLDRHRDEVMWMDSDIILTRSLSGVLDTLPRDALIVTEDPPGLWPAGTEARTKGWGYPVGRSLATSVNSCVVRAGPAHRSLIAAWVGAIESEPYQRAQRRHWSDRPFYFLGDQDALAALLGSSDHADVSAAFLRSGRDIAQCYFANGYSWQSRLINLFRGAPGLVHAQGEKPWDPPTPVPVYLDICPYKIHSRQYRDALVQTGWLDVKSALGRFLMAASWSHPDLPGVIPAALEWAKTTIRRWRRRSVELGTDQPE